MDLAWPGPRVRVLDELELRPPPLSAGLIAHDRCSVGERGLEREGAVGRRPERQRKRKGRTGDGDRARKRRKWEKEREGGLRLTLARPSIPRAPPRTLVSHPRNATPTHPTMRFARLLCSCCDRDDGTPGFSLLPRKMG